MLCKAAGVRVQPSSPDDYAAGTITLFDIRRISLITPTPPTPVPFASPAASASTSAPSFGTPSSASASTASVSSPDRDMDMMLPHPPRALPVTPIDISDQERPDRPSVVSTVRCSNRLRSRIVVGVHLPSSSRRPSARQKIPVSPPLLASSTPLFDLASQSMPVPTSAIAAATVPVVPAASSPPPLVVAAPVSSSPSPVPPPPPSAPFFSSAVPLPTEQILMLDALVQILRTMAENQTLYFDYAVARDQCYWDFLTATLLQWSTAASQPWPEPPAFNPLDAAADAPPPSDH